MAHYVSVLLFHPRSFPHSVVCLCLVQRDQHHPALSSFSGDTSLLLLAGLCRSVACHVLLCFSLGRLGCSSVASVFRRKTKEKKRKKLELVHSLPIPPFLLSLVFVFVVISRVFFLFLFVVVVVVDHMLFGG